MNTELHKSIRSAIKAGDTAVVKKLLGANESAATMMTPFGTWLHVAASFGQIDIVKVLVENFKLDVNVRGGVANGNALHRAASEGALEVVRYLLDAGAEMDVSEPDRNPLFGSILSGNIEVARLLIQKGIDTSVKYTGSSMEGMGALEFARERGRSDFVALLAKKS